jgi:hypothetical protein
MIKVCRVGALALVAIAGGVIGCSAEATDRAPNQGGTDAGTGALSPARQVVAANAAAERDLHLVARKYVNDETEVIEFYEPMPGRVLISAAGSPVAGSVLSAAAIKEKSAAELWALVAPGEAIPQALADAIARSQLPTAQPGSSHPATAQAASRRDAAFGAPSSELGRVQTDTGTPPGYCASQFWSDWKNEPGIYGDGPIYTDTWNYGWNTQSFSNVQWAAGFMVCPQGNVSGTGGVLTVSLPNGTSPAFNVGPNYYRVETWKTGYDCGFDLTCYGTRCSPIGFDISAQYQSECYLTKGTSCGDNYDWEDWWVGASSYCEN